MAGSEQDTHRVVLHVQDEEGLPFGDFLALLDQLGPWDASGALRGYVCEIRLTVGAGSVGDALTAASATLQQARAACGLPADRIVAAGVNASGEAGWPWNPSGGLELVGLEEIAELFEASRRQFEDVAADPRFPQPLGRVAGRPVWDRQQVLDHVAMELPPRRPATDHQPAF